MRNKILGKVFGIFRFLLISVFSVVLFSGCTKTLTRDDAGKIIVKSLGFPKTVTFDLHQKYFVGGGPYDLGQPSPMIPWLNWAVSAGLINLIKEMGFAGMEGSVLVTEEGRKYVVSVPRDISSPWLIKFGEKIFINVTGISLTGDNKQAKVEYSWKYGNYTPFCSPGDRNGTYDEKVVHGSTVNMSLYDDGWRIKE